MLVKHNEPDWADPTLARWLDSIVKDGTKRNYRSAFRAYHLFTHQSATQLVDEALADANREQRERRDIVLQRLVQFFNWLKTEYPRKKRGRGEHTVIGKGISDKLAHMYVNAIRSFYATFNVNVRLKGRHSLPKPRVKNKRMIVDATQVKTLVAHARTLRDKAMILTLFQSGMDVSTLCSLTYGDVAEGLTRDEHPLKLELYRQKAGTEFYTFLGREAVDAIRVYIADMHARGVAFEKDTALFLKERGKDQLTTNLVQNMMQDVAVRSGLVDKRNNGNFFNPLGPHALRESFGSIMINSGVPDTVVDFWLGHTIGEMSEAYKSVQYDSVKRMYLEREHLLSLSQPKVDVDALRAKLRGEVQQQNQQLQTLANGLSTENLELRSRMAQMELANTKREQKVAALEQKLDDVERVLAELKGLLQHAEDEEKPD